jgi:hypothetical protein
MLDSCSNGDGPWTSADALSFVMPIVEFFVDKLGVVGRDIDEGGVEYR